MCSPPHGDPLGPGGWVHKHNHEPVVQDILVALFNCHLLPLFWFSSLVGVLVVLVGGAGGLRSSHNPPVTCIDWACSVANSHMASIANASSFTRRIHVKWEKDHAIWGSCADSPPRHHISVPGFRSA